MDLTDEKSSKMVSWNHPTKNVFASKMGTLLKIWSGWWYTNPSEKYESQLGWLFPIYGKIKNVPNHQSVMILLHT